MEIILDFQVDPNATTNVLKEGGGERRNMGRREGNVAAAAETGMT